jgi:diguanylate cyclase (GGDEF)-like protein
MGLLTLLYLCGLLVLAHQVSRSVRVAVTLDAQNVRLLHELGDAREELERRVVQRTQELTSTNLALQREIAQRRRSEQRARHLLMHDALTNLPNRILFVDRLRSALARARRQGDLVGVMMIDVDQFKAVNDSHGHPAGDAVLIQVAARLAARLRATDTVARIGGDEFAVVVPDLASRGDAVHLARELVGACAAPVEIAGSPLLIGCSAGIALFPDHGRDIDALMSGADLALYRAKAQGRGTICLLDAALQEEWTARRRMEARLRGVAMRDELQLAFQPLIELQGGRLVGAEALLRWRHPEFGLLPPADFIPIAETTGAIREIGRWVLDTACTQAAEWQHELGGLRVAVNISAEEFGQPDLPDVIQACLQRTGMRPESLDLEITETVCVQDLPGADGRALWRLKELGVGIAVDDFGTGYSSLAYLKTLPIDRLKIDRSFIANVTTDERDEAILAAVVALATRLGKRAVAEGVETEAQLAAVRRLGCHEAQGFLLGAPGPAELIAEGRRPLSRAFSAAG